MNMRIRLATTNRASTLPVQIIASHPRRRHNGCFSACSISCNEGLPNIIPPSVSIWDAAAPPQSQGFMLVGTLFIIPFILGYTFWSYYVFRGKVTHEDGYH